MTTEKKKIEYDTVYVPEFVQKATSGANMKLKKAGRPFTIDVRTYRIRTKESGMILQTYLMFGGVPSPKLHALLEDAEFKLRRRPRTWKDKNGNVVDIAGRNNECYAVYYSTNSEITQDQTTLIAKLLLALNKTLPTGSKTYLLPNWERIEEEWGAKDEWLKLCAVDSSAQKNTPAPEPEEEKPEPTPGVLDDIDDLI